MQYPSAAFRLLGLKVLAWVVLAGPLMALWNRPLWFNTIPLTPLALMLIWMGLIILMAFWSRSSINKPEDDVA